MRPAARNACRCAAAALVALAAIAAVDPAGADAGSAYVGGTGNVSVIDTDSNTLTKEITVSGDVRGVAISPDGTRVYAATSNLFYVIDSSSNTVVGMIPIIGGGEIAVTPDGTRAYVAGFTVSSPFVNQVSVIDASTNTVSKTISGFNEGPFGLGLTPNGSTLYVATDNGENATNSVQIVDTASDTIVGAISAGQDPTEISLTPDGSRAYVVTQGSNMVVVIDTSTNQLLNVNLPVVNPSGTIATSSTEELSYVPRPNAGEVAVIDGNILDTPITVGDAPFSVAFTPDGSSAYLVKSSNEVVEVDASTSQVVGSPILVGAGAYTIAIAPSQPPTASFTSAPVVPKAGARDRTTQALGSRATKPVTIDFNASASTDTDSLIATYAWDFGDGKTETLNSATASHTYGNPGTYTARLTLTNDEGCSTAETFTYTGRTASCNGNSDATTTRQVLVPGALDLKLRSRSKQKPNKMVLRVSCGDQECATKITGKATIPGKDGKKKRLNLKPRRPNVAANQTNRVTLKFNKNSKRVEQIKRLLKQSKKARKQARVHTKVKADGVGGDATVKEKFRLKK